jgi:hypothetical protein
MVVGQVGNVGNLRADCFIGRLRRLTIGAQDTILPHRQTNSDVGASLR